MNNVFITDWNEKDYTRLDFGDIFERFYKEAYGINCPYVMNDNLSVKNEYRIPADEFENSHKVTILEEDGRTYYLSNEIVGGEEPDLWWHAVRCTDESE